MATTTFHDYTGDGSDKTFDYSFPTFSASEVVVEVGGVIVDNYTIPNYATSGTQTVTFDNSTGTVNSTVCEADGSPKNQLLVRIRRNTSTDTRKRDYTAGSSLKADDLTTNNTQLLRASQDRELKTDVITNVLIKDGVITSSKIKDGTIVNADISPTAEIAVSKLADGSARQLLQTAANGNDVEWTSNVDIPGTLDVTGAVDFDSNLNVDGTATLATVDINGGNIDGTPIGANSASTGTFTVLNVTTGQTTLGTESDDYVNINGKVSTNIIPNSTWPGSQKYLGTTGNPWSIKAGTIAAQGYITTDGTLTANEVSLADNKKITFGTSDDTEVYDTGTAFNIDAGGTIVFDTHTGSYSVSCQGVPKLGWTSLAGGVWVGDDIVPYIGESGQHDIGSSTKQFKDIYIDGVAYVDEIRLDDNQKIKLGDAADDDGEIWYSGNTLYIDSDKGLNLDTGNGSFTVNANGAFKLGWTSVVGGLVDDDWLPYQSNTHNLGTNTFQWKDLYIDGTAYLDTADIGSITGDAIVTSGTSSSDTEVYSAKRTEALFLRQDSTETLASGVAWSSNDTTVPTTGAIDARVRGLITDVGGFRPIASEAAFPTTNPDPDDNAGTIVSITALSADRTASGTTLTAGCQTTGGTQVTITGCPNNQVFKQGYGLLVETTSTLNTYTFVRYVADTSSVATVAGNNNNVTTVAGISANVTTVAGISSNVTTVAGISSDVTTVANDGTDIGTVAGISSNVTTVAGISGNVTTVANNNSNVTAVANNSSNINSAVSNASNINSAVSNASNINSAVSNASNINTVAGNNTNINTVAGISGNVTTVAGNNGNVTTVAGSIANVNTTAGSIANVNTTAGAIANVNTVAGSIANVNTVGSNITNVTNASTYLNNFLSLYLGTAASAPTQDALGNPVTEGDLYFNTGNKQLQIYNGSVFTNIVDTAIDFAKSATAAFNALYTASAGSNSIDLGGLAITGAPFANEALATNRISLAQGSATYNLGGI